MKDFQVLNEKVECHFVIPLQLMELDKTISKYYIVI